MAEPFKHPAELLKPFEKIKSSAESLKNSATVKDKIYLDLQSNVSNIYKR